MPRKNIDYSKTIIYRIVCKDVNITDCYVGSTTDFIRRKNQHKNNTKNYISKSELFVYEVIRKNGGWENWNCVILEECVCKNEYLAKERMNFYILKNKPKLNMKFL